MPTIINDPATLHALSEKGCLSADDTVDRDAIVRAVAAELEANHVADTADDVRDAAIDVGQLTVDIFGVEDPELTKLVRGQLATTPNGKVQTALANGHVLCPTKTKVTMRLPGGETKSYTQAARFVTGDPDTIQKHLMDPTGKRIVSAAKSVDRVGGMIKTRNPEMATRVDEWTGQMQIVFQTAITSSSGS